MWRGAGVVAVVVGVSVCAISGRWLVALVDCASRSGGSGACGRVSASAANRTRRVLPVWCIVGGVGGDKVRLSLWLWWVVWAAAWWLNMLG